MPKESSEIKEISELVTLLKNSKELVPRTKLLLIVNNDKRLTRRLQTIRDTFLNFYLLHVNGKGYRLINMQQIKIKKTSNKDPILHIGVNKSINTLNQIIEAAHKAKDKKCQLELFDYKGVTGKPSKDYTVSVIDLVINHDPYILAVTDTDKTKIKTFKLSRVGNFLLKEKVNGFAGKLTSEHILRDDFGFIIDKESDCRKMELLLTNYSLNMLLHDFPHFSERVTSLKNADIIKETVNGNHYHYCYRLKLKYVSVKPLRVIIGLLDQIKVIAEQSTLEEFRNFINKTVLDCIQGNLINDKFSEHFLFYT